MLFTKNNLTLLDFTLLKHDDEISPHATEMANDAHYPARSEWFHFATLQYIETTAQKLGEGKTAEIDERQLRKRNVKTIT